MTRSSNITRARRLWLSLALVLCCAPAAAGATQTFVTVTDADAVTVNVNSGSVVALRGLTLSGTSSSRGIVYTGPGAVRAGDDSEPGASLHVEDCTFSGFSIAGISFSGNGALFVKDTTVRNTLGSGIDVSAPSGQRARATIVNSRLEKNETGLYAHGHGTVEVTARDTVAAGNKNNGFAATQAVWATVRMQLQGCVATHQGAGVWALDGARVTLEGCALTNMGTGIFVSSAAQIRLSNTTITDNEVGISNTLLFGAGVHGQVHTFGNNRVHGNKQDTVGKPSLPAQQF
jgi:hypothetical protein